MFIKRCFLSRCTRKDTFVEEELWKVLLGLENDVTENSVFFFFPNLTSSQI